MNDNIDLDSEEFGLELEDIQKEFEDLNSQAESGFDWVCLLCDLHSSIEIFNSHMASLNVGIECQKENSEQHSFLYGILLVGIISAYEGFNHELFNACCNKRDYIDKAVSNFNRLSPEDLNKLGICRKRSKEITAKDLKELLSNATLNNPLRIASISRELFGLELPAFKEDEQLIVRDLLAYRNDFTHNNGYSCGVPIKITHEKVKLVHFHMHNLINRYFEKIIKESKELLES